MIERLVVCGVISVLVTYAALLSIFTINFNRFTRAEDQRRHDFGEKRYKEGVTTGRKMAKD